MREENPDIDGQQQLKLKFGEKPKNLQGKSRTYPPPGSRYASRLAIGEKLADGKVVLFSLNFEEFEKIKNTNGRLFIPLMVHLGWQGYGTIRPALKEELK